MAVSSGMALVRGLPPLVHLVGTGLMASLHLADKAQAATRQRVVHVDVHLVLFYFDHPPGILPSLGVHQGHHGAGLDVLGIEMSVDGKQALV